ncbi:unnamed protein product [Phytomonas sp. Hart1]|nr:unnamed protein product [Phytomonas sp. Hart1]|eukprot:CCW71203.1 unnamed protein product [Phytomonas sp. isolate Hart1]
MIRMFTCGELPLMDIVELQGKIHIQPESEASDFNPKDKFNQKEVFLGEVRPDRLRADGCTLRMGTLCVDGSREALKLPILVLKRCDPARKKTISAQIRRRLQREAKKSHKGDQKQKREEAHEVDFRDSNDVGDTVLFSDWIDAHPEYLSLDYLFFGGGQGNLCHGNARDRSNQNDSDTMVLNNNPDFSSTAVKFRSEVSLDSPSDEIVKGGRSVDMDELSDESLSEYEKKEREVDVAGENEEMFTDYEVVGLVENYVVFNGKPARVFS